MAFGRLRFGFEIAEDRYGRNISEVRGVSRSSGSRKKEDKPTCLTAMHHARTIHERCSCEIGMHLFLKLLGWALLASALAACNTPPHRQAFPEITFQHLQPFRLDVARVQIVDGYQADPAHDIGSQFPEAPATVARQWAEDRLLAVGQQGEAIYTITLAKATQTPLKRSQGMAAMTHKDQSDRYDLAITVNLEVRAGGKSGAVTAQAARSQTVREDTTLNQREGVLFNLLDVTMKDVNAQMEKVMPQYLGGFLR